MSNQDFLLELGCEELPQHSQYPLAQQLAEKLESQLTQKRIAFGTSYVFATPRRLCIYIQEVALQQQTERLQRFGPSVEHAYDKEGIPTMACMGFASACGIQADQLEVIDTDKGQRLCANIEQPGHETLEILPKLIEQTVSQLNLKKSMRWGSHPIPFIRPVHWVLALLGQSIIPVSLFDLKASNETEGHRFHYPKRFKIKHAKDYCLQLYTQGYVIANFEDRRKTILKQIKHYNQHDIETVMQHELLDEVTALVEWPVTLKGQFSPDFLQLPKEVLITSMQSHQKCFAMQNTEGKLLANFLLVSNIESPTPEFIIQGNERVINARLSDAMFFYRNDQQQTLMSRLKKLESVVFQEQLGSLRDKVSRLVKLANYLSKETLSDTAITKRAAQLCKCDLVSEMVVEFPSLQGTMGYYYALHDQEDRRCAHAIKEHYQPRFATDILPASNEGATLAIADRLDTIIGILGIHQSPTGDKDPYALRRAALGIIRIIIERNYPIDLKLAIQRAIKGYNALPNPETEVQVYEFIMARLKAWYLEQGISAQVFSAVAANSITKPYDFHLRILAVQHFQRLSQAQSLSRANKRVNNLLKKQSISTKKYKIDPNIFQEIAEHTLADALEHQNIALKPLIEKADYTTALNQLATLEKPVDDFFDNVMVMDENTTIRNNRLCLLASLQELFLQVADISELQAS